MASPRPPELAQWWKRLGDPMLDQLIDKAVAGNLDVANANARIRESRASYRQAVGAELPSADAGAAATRSKGGGDISSQFRGGHQGLLNTDDIRQTITSATQTMPLLIASIAVISLIVGGIGVMNIMLVSVSENVSEIGVRMAVRAPQGDILQQFLIEAVLVCLIGGQVGIGAALSFGAIFGALSSNFTLIYSTTSIIVAFLCSSLIGIVFGYLPARNASRLDPVAALSKE